MAGVGLGEVGVRVAWEMIGAWADFGGPASALLDGVELGQAHDREERDFAAAAKRESPPVFAVHEGTGIPPLSAAIAENSKRRQYRREVSFSEVTAAGV
jgi:hypothetical protein